MALTIVQKPLQAQGFGAIKVEDLYSFRLPVGQQIIFAVSDNTTVATKYKVKFVAEVHVSDAFVINFSNLDTRVGIFKTTPNNEGVGIFDFQAVLETFVKPDNDASEESAYKNSFSRELEFPIHLINKFSLSENAIKFFAIKFYVEYSDDPFGDLVSTAGTNFRTTMTYVFFNGVLQPDDALTLVDGDYGYDLSRFASTYPYYHLEFLSNAPTTQYARLTDYGTLPFFNWTRRLSNFQPQNTERVTYNFYNADGLADTYYVTNNTIYGGVDNFTFEAKDFLMYVAAFPANLRQYNSAIDALFLLTGDSKITHYTIQLTDDAGDTSVLSTVYIICPNLKGYEGIRLTWLNQWGTWDYYTFTRKSTKSVKTKRIPYQQQGGTWNESKFKIKGWKGGKKNFRVNSTERIKINTDFVTEAEGVWFEELISSPDVYIVNEYDGSENTVDKITNKYIEPVTLITSNYVKKTIANDKLMQYTFEIEKSKMQRTQAV
jgi:hypothetical protein